MAPNDAAPSSACLRLTTSPPPDARAPQVALTAKDPNAAPSERGPGGGGGRKPGADISEYVGADDKEYITGTVSRIQEYGARTRL